MCSYQKFNPSQRNPILFNLAHFSWSKTNVENDRKKKHFAVNISKFNFAYLILSIEEYEYIFDKLNRELENSFFKLLV